MKILLRRFFSDSDRTLGILHIDGVFSCFTIEDAYHKVKIKGKTRIPEGEYTLKLRNEGGMNVKYSSMFGQRHKGMLWLQNVKDFEYVYIHIGNTEIDTEGCILVGKLPAMNGDKYSVIQSTPAYLKLYAMVTAHIELNEPVSIRIVNIEGERL